MVRVESQFFFVPVGNFNHCIFCDISVRFLLARLATGRENKTNYITHLFQAVIKFVNFGTNCKEKCITPQPPGLRHVLFTSGL